MRIGAVAAFGGTTRLPRLVGKGRAAELGADYFGLVAATEDFRAGTHAFVEKTRPVFTGR